MITLVLMFEIAILSRRVLSLREITLAQRYCLLRVLSNI